MANPEIHYSEKTGEIQFLLGEPVDIMLPRKTSKELFGDRTVNRHR